MFFTGFSYAFPAEYETIQRNENPQTTKNTGFRGQMGYPPCVIPRIFA